MADIKRERDLTQILRNARGKYSLEEGRIVDSKNDMHSAIEDPEMINYIRCAVVRRNPACERDIARGLSATEVHHRHAEDEEGEEEIDAPKDFDASYPVELILRRRIGRYEGLGLVARFEGQPVDRFQECEDIVALVVDFG